METDAFESLLSRMPDIAKAVNNFTSPEIQQQAFDALMRTAGVSPTSAPASRGLSTATPSSSTSGGEGSGTSAPSSSVKRGNGAQKAKKSVVSAPTVIDDLQLRPADTQSFRDFVGIKNPAHTNDKNVVCVYYLKHVLATGPVSVNHVYTCYREMSWKLPNNLRNALQVTASTTKFISTKNMDDIGLTAMGMNRVEHDLPATSRK